MNICYLSSEASPLVKIGGLGDVAGSLPKAIKALGHDICLVLPDYDAIDKTQYPAEEIASLSVVYNGQEEYLTISKSSLPDSDVPVFLLGNKTYIASGGTSVHEDHAITVDRYAFFSLAVAQLMKQHTEILGSIDVVNCNDWHTALIPLLLKNLLDKPPKTVLTIHNLSYQGITDQTLKEKLGILEAKIPVTQDQNGDINILREGILRADMLSTVSENYAKEILTKEFGEHLEDLLNTRKDQLSGIINGIDTQYWDPEHDNHLAMNYQITGEKSDITQARSINKSTLQAKLTLSSSHRPVLGFIGRIDPQQKGIDILTGWLEAIEEKTDPGYHVVILGTGDASWEERLLQLGEARSEWLSVNILFDEGLAHLMYAGCDFILVPSKFEPCGLPQMIAQRYGALPIVHAVGGLRDTVTDNETGFVFTDYTRAALHETVDKAVGTYQNDHYWTMIQNSFNKDYSWAISAKKYLKLYEAALA